MIAAIHMHMTMRDSKGAAFDQAVTFSQRTASLPAGFTMAISGGNWISAGGKTQTAAPAPSCNQRDYPRTMRMSVRGNRRVERDRTVRRRQSLNVEIIDGNDDVTGIGGWMKQQPRGANAAELGAVTGVVGIDNRIVCEQNETVSRCPDTVGIYRHLVVCD